MDYIKKIERLEKENELYKRQNKGIRDCTIASMKERIIEVINKWHDKDGYSDFDELITKIKRIK